MKSTDPMDPREQLACIARMMEQFRAQKQRRLLRRARRLWRQTEIQHQLTRLEAPRERVH